MSDALPPWRVLASRTVVSDRWLTLRADTCETREGATIDPFYVVEGPDVAVVVAITASSELVLVRQYRHGYGAVTLEIPGGAVDEGESPISAGLRELMEETGYTGASARLIRAASPNTLRYANRFHVVLVEDVTRTHAPATDTLERVETVLWPLDDLGQLLSRAEFANLALTGALFLALAASSANATVAV